MINPAFFLSQSLLNTLHDLIQISDPESDVGFAKRSREASDSALLLSTTKVLDDIFGSNDFTFPHRMQQQPPIYENILTGSPPGKKSQQGSSGRKRKTSGTKSQNRTEAPKV